MSLAAAVQSSQSTKLPERGRVERIDRVVVEGSVVMKIIRHVRQDPFSDAQGPILGLAIGNDLHISNCFPTLSESEGAEDDSGESEGSRHDARMCHHLQTFNMDYLTVGWYQSAHMSSFYSEDVIRGQFNYQKEFPEAVLLIYDPTETASGTLSLQAYRLSANFMAAFEGEDFSPAAIKKFGLTYENILESVPVVLKTSPLSKVFIDEVRGKSDSTSPLARLDLASQQYLEKNLELLMTCVDDLNAETQKYSTYLKEANRRDQLVAQYELRYKAECADREARGLEPLPHEDIEAMHKPVKAPSRLEALLVTSQINRYAAQVQGFSSTNFAKLFTAGALAGKQ